MADLTKKKLISEYETRDFASGDYLVTYREGAADNEKTGRSLLGVGTSSGIIDGSGTSPKIYTDEAIKGGVEGLAVDLIYEGLTLIGSSLGGSSVDLGLEPENGLYVVELTTPAGLNGMIFEITGSDTTQVIGSTVISGDLVNIVATYDSSTTTMTISDLRSDGSTNAVVIGDLYRVGA